MPEDKDTFDKIGSRIKERGQGMAQHLSHIASAMTLACIQGGLLLLLAGPALGSSREAPAPSPCPEGQADCRPTFHAELQLGLLVNTFAADELRTYLNPDDSSSTGTELTAGFSVAYRLTGQGWQPNSSQLWIYGRSIYGARSADVDCANHADLAVCKLEASPLDPDPGTVVDSAIYLLTHATSLEVYTGLRWEPRAFRVDTDAPMRPYVKLELGFINVEGAGSGLERNQVALGFSLTRGAFISSFLEVGYGASDFFATNPGDRFKLEAMLRWQLSKGFGTFAQLSLIHI